MLDWKFSTRIGTCNASRAESDGAAACFKDEVELREAVDYYSEVGKDYFQYTSWIDRHVSVDDRKIAAYKTKFHEKAGRMIEDMRESHVLRRLMIVTKMLQVSIKYIDYLHIPKIFYHCASTISIFFSAGGKDIKVSFNVPDLHASCV